MAVRRPEWTKSSGVSRKAKAVNLIGLGRGAEAVNEIWYEICYEMIICQWTILTEKVPDQTTVKVRDSVQVIRRWYAGFGRIQAGLLVGVVSEYET